MAEYVQRSCESMIKELEVLRRIKLFSDDEINRIIVVRKHMESKIHNVSKSLDDFKSYISYEKLLLKKIHQRQNERGISEKKGWLDNRILFRITRLYQTAVQRFRSDYSFYVEFFKFCRKHKLNSAASQAVDIIIKMFSHKPEVWILAAKWYWHLKDANRALKTLQKGFTIHKQSIDLYNKAIKLELDQLSEADSDVRSIQEQLCVVKIKTYVSLILRNITDLGDILSTLKIVQDHEILKETQEEISRHVFQNYTMDGHLLPPFEEQVRALEEGG
ncbi:U3 small nucleolar RNA-associated protein 6 homolog [Coccinella septempunctata]|uniref:U3 small nucleolar RNA-associated protein 6 homolog n=1 Tax=Coccinella septempunctata TaxID=41139 RepID=UPI001D07A74F|nr:U3 small nucleolar RNA-associated protein 6 homolog [Coccinella septempunctata]